MRAAKAIWTCLAILAIPLLLQAQSPPIDNFDNPIAPVQSVQANAGTTPDGDATVVAVLGGERDLLATHSSGAANIDVLVEANLNQRLEFSAGSSTDGSGDAVWDGADGDPYTIDYTGLGGVDLTTNGDDRIRLKDVGTDWQCEYTITIWTDAANYCSNSQIIPQLSSGLMIDFLYSGFVDSPCSGTVDFTNVGAIRVHIGSAGSWDVLPDTDSRFAYITTPVELVAFSADE